MERRGDPLRQQRFEKAVASIASRLARVCSSWPSDEFAEFVERVAAIEIKYATRRSEDLFVDIAAEPGRPR